MIVGHDSRDFEKCCAWSVNIFVLTKTPDFLFWISPTEDKRASDISYFLSCFRDKFQRREARGENTPWLRRLARDVDCLMKARVAVQ